MSWITRRFNGCKWLWFPLAVLLFSTSVAGVEDLFGINGNVYSGGVALTTGNASFKLSIDACASAFYDSGDDFNDSISAGQFDVMLGNASLTVLQFDPTERYVWLREYIDGLGQNWNSVGGSCLPFSNPFYMNNVTILQVINAWNATNYQQWLNTTSYSDEWWINRETINATAVNFTFNQSNHDTIYYNKSEVNDFLASIAFELYLYNTTSTEIATYNIMNSTHPTGAEKSIEITVAADATPIQEFETNSSVNELASGIYTAHIHANATTAGKQDARIYWELYLRYSNTTETLLITSGESHILTASDASYEIHGISTEEVEVNASSDKLVVKFYANLEGGGGNPDVWILVEGHTASRFVLQTEADVFDNIYLLLSGTNANQNINISVYNLTSTESWFFGNVNASSIQNALWITHATASTTYLYLNGSNANQNIDLGVYNVSASWFKGNFSWTCADANCSFNGSVLQINASTTSSTPIARSVTYDRVQRAVTGTLYSNVELANITVTLAKTFDGAYYPLYVPRTVNYSLTNFDIQFGLFYEFNVTGIDQDNNDYYEYQSGALGASAAVQFESDKAFAIVYNFTFNMSTNGGLFPSALIDIGRGNWIGLPHYPLTSVYKVVADGLQVEENIIYNTTYGKVYLNETVSNGSRTYWYVS